MKENQVYRIVSDATKLSRAGYEAMRDGYCEAYFLEGLYHRDDDHPSYKDINGVQKWYTQGVLNRLSGPAEITCSGDRYIIKGVEIDGSMKSLFIEILTMPIAQVPLYINHDVIGVVASERLRRGR